MGYRVLIDENFSPQTAERLRDAGHEALASLRVDALGQGASDGGIVEYAREGGYAVVTNDTDFLRPPLREQCQVLFVDDDTLRAHELADRIDRLSGLVAQADLPPVYRLTDSSLP